MRVVASAVVLSFFFAQASLASEGPQPAPLPPPIPVARDVPFNGQITLDVDASNLSQRIYRVRESIPVQAAGPMVLLYPQWETASHAPTASVAGLTGLTVVSNGRPLKWERDTVNMFAFHVDVPADAKALDVSFQYLSPFSLRQGAVVMTASTVTVPWQNVVLYPAGWFTRNIPVSARVTLPNGFASATALESNPGDASGFRTTSLETLVDSPVYASRHVGRYALARKGEAPVTLNVFADDERRIAIKSAQLDALRAMVQQAGKVFPKRHYRHYDFLLALDNALPGPGGSEQAQSSTDTLPPDYFAGDERDLINADLLAHEFVHSWNGRYRQPADLWTADFNTPARGSLLWVYEGQTEFWGRVLAARSGLRTKQETLDALAVGAAQVLAQKGRTWKSLQDSTNDAIITAGGRSTSWRDWQRREDYYGEGVFLWLAVDAEIREQTHEVKGIDDFARDFFAGGAEGDLSTRTYAFADVCAALNRVAPLDWAGFLRKRLDTHDPTIVLNGIEREGYRLVFDGTPSDYSRANELDSGASDFSSAIGFTIGKGGVIRSVAWEGPAFKAGLAPGIKIDAINGKPYSFESLAALLRNRSPAPLKLTWSVDGETMSTTLHASGPLQYAHLARLGSAPDRLGELLAPR
ncbi:M61 family metallopeptidase [Luteibacter sp. 22Crub2.1]|uniref:M61 family metallopeptidase n=1 Tax=Luteibacter sp. 22Crub2.1 TaxID=1283288 RepID=UPI0009A5B055|nr:M61 family metallopeptidase [Luteibacter sp. 22Crub2.1]SKC00997.1 glycyl aminopeptidase. Metallo peptidase. MEROPS family M61 [Luteibacter sp. 22Crub2.1]